MKKPRFACALTVLLVCLVVAAQAQVSPVGHVSDVKPDNVPIANRGSISRSDALRLDVVKNEQLFENDLLQLFRGVLADLDLGEMRIVAGDPQQVGAGRYQIRQGRAESVGGIVFAILHGTAALESVARNVRCWVDIVRRDNEILMDELCEDGDQAALYRPGDFHLRYGRSQTERIGYLPTGGRPLAYRYATAAVIGNSASEQIQFMVSVDSTTGVVECFLNSGSVRFPEYENRVISDPGSFWEWRPDSAPTRVALTLAERRLWQSRTDYHVRDVWKAGRKPIFRQRWFQGVILGAAAVTTGIIVTRSGNEKTSGAIRITLPG